MARTPFGCSNSMRRTWGDWNLPGTSGKDTLAALQRYHYAIAGFAPIAPGTQFPRAVEMNSPITSTAIMPPTFEKSTHT